MKIGAHVSASGGAHKIFQRGTELGCECLQLFTRAPSQWKAKPLTDDQIELFRSERIAHGSQSVIAHDIYLNNLAAEDDKIRRRSIKTMVEEVTRCHQLGVDGLVCHLGSHPGGPKPGIRRYASAVKTILARTETTPTPILLETCAGQGNCLGHQLEEIAEVIRRSSPTRRLCRHLPHFRGRIRFARSKRVRAVLGTVRQTYRTLTPQSFPSQRLQKTAGKPRGPPRSHRGRRNWRIHFPISFERSEIPRPTRRHRNPRVPIDGQDQS